MNKARKVLMVGLLSATGLLAVYQTLALPSTAPSTCTFVVPDKVTSGEEWYGHHNWAWCNQPWLDNLKAGYSMDRSDWDDGFGFNDPCNTDLPFARVVTARVALEVSSPDPQRTGTIATSTALIRDWGLLFTWLNITDLSASCGFDESEPAWFQRNLFGDYIELRVLANNRWDMGFFYGFDVPTRASILVHEARHADGGPDHVNDRGQDQRFNDGGSNSYDIIWLHQYANFAISEPPASRVPPAWLRCKAARLGNNRLASLFVERPDFHIPTEEIPDCDML